MYQPPAWRYEQPTGGLRAESIPSILEGYVDNFAFHKAALSCMEGGS